MSSFQLPPQAYTRDVLAQAYEWLHQQPPSVQELATNADALVALYMQSRRRMGQPLPPATPSTENIVGPASAEAFKNDLKALAEGFRQFEGPRRHEMDARPAPPAAPLSTPANPVSVPVAPASHPVAPVATTANSHSNILDQKSLEVIRDVQRRLNLSNEQEAVRLLLAIGYDRIRDVLPKGPRHG